AARLVEFLRKPLHLMEDAAAMLEHEPAGCGGRDAPTVADQQALPGFDLEGADLAAERRLGNTQGMRGTGEAPELGDADEILELAQVQSRLDMEFSDTLHTTMPIRHNC